MTDSYSILIIEDEKLLAYSLKALLEQNGFEADAACDGKTGEYYAALGIYDLLILDEVLGLVDQEVISREEFIRFLQSADDETDLIMTGRVCPEGIEKYVNEISVVSTGKNLRISQAENIDIDNHQE